VTANKRKPLLIVEDDPALQKQMRWAFDNNEILVANDSATAIAQIRRHEPSVITLDLGLPPHPDDSAAGFELLQDILKLAPHSKVIVLTGQNDHKNALKAIQLGAHDFYAKPFEPELLGATIERAFRLHELQEENRRLQSAAHAAPLTGFLTQDAEMLRICRTAEKIAPTNATVLLLGESGTGKELIARALHELSQRKKERLIAINCAAIPETLLESELFGYEKGAFTGAAKQTPGKLEVANKGTLFLDEIGDLPLSLQAKLLRFLQERVIERVGGREEISIDVRVICATHRNIKEMIVRGLFREDLYFRIAEIVLEIPPLRRRPGDATLLSQAIVRRTASDQNRHAMSLRPDAIDAIEAHSWPGNVRELENCLKRAVIMADGNLIGPEDLGLQAVTTSNVLNLKQVREDAERQAVTRVVARTNGNLSKAAELLGISRPTLYELLDRFGLR
jgi:two-component system, NtrC family, response regulator